MEISTLRHNQVTECEACGALFCTTVAGDPAARGLMARHDSHVNGSPDCSAYFATLPTLADVQEAARPAPEGAE